MEWKACKRFNKNEFERAWKAAQSIALPGKLSKVEHDWQLFIYREDGVCIVFYPYKCPSATGHVVRIRDQGSHDKTRLKEVMLHIEENDCGYGFGSRHMYARAGIHERIEFKKAKTK